MNSPEAITEKDFATITPLPEAASIRMAAMQYEATAMLHQREVIRLNKLARQAHEAADKLEETPTTEKI